MISPIYSFDLIFIKNGCISFSSTDRFIKKHKLKSDFRWKYCNVLYENYDSLISLTCPTHGLQKAMKAEYLLKGFGCKKCSVSKIKILPLEEKIKHFNITHNYKYDYSLVSNQNFSMRSKISIICPIHGKFEQRASSHKEGQGCPKCSILKNNITVNEFKSRIEELNSSISFNERDFVNMTTDLSFYCSIHGEFSGKPCSLLNNSKFCPNCGYELTSEKLRVDSSNYLARAIKIHDNKYSYDNFTAIKSKEKSYITCPVHGDFLSSWNYHVHSKNGCPKCGGQKSEEEEKILSFVSSIYSGEIKSRFRPVFLEGKELDIYLPDLNVAIEYNGSYWHSEKYRDRKYHFEKWLLCKKNNITLLNIWDHYWKNKNKKNIYKHKIIHLLGLDETIYARKCIISEITKKEYDSFIFSNHLDGLVFPYKDMKYVGLFYNGTIVMVAGYGLFWNQSLGKFHYKLQRICTLLGLTVVGGVSKLSTYLKKDIGDFQFQITLDTGGKLLNKIPTINDVSIRYWWVNNNLDFKTRNDCQISKLKLNNDWEENDTEKTYMEKNKWYRVYDTGIISI